MSELKIKESSSKIRGHHLQDNKWVSEIKEEVDHKGFLDTTIDLWENTTDVLEQFLNNPDSIACRTLAENCVRLNKELLAGEWKSKQKENE